MTVPNVIDNGVAGGGGGGGAQGPQGAQGSQGIQGIQGPQGWQGYGAQGLQGPQGSQGAQGSQGWQGPEGPAAGAPSDIVEASSSQNYGGAGVYGALDSMSITIATGGVYEVWGRCVSQSTKGGTFDLKIYIDDVADNDTLSVSPELVSNEVFGRYTLAAGSTVKLYGAASAGAVETYTYRQLMVMAAMGTQGFQGPQGAQGNQGPQGAQGAQGWQGDVGSGGVVYPKNANAKGVGERLYGFIASYNAGANGNIWANLDVFWPFYLPKDTVIDLVTFKVTGGNAPGRNISWAIYDNVAEDTCYPNARIITPPEVDCSVTGWMDYSPGAPVSCPAGLYWVGMNANNAGITFLGIAPASICDSAMFIGYNKNEIDGGLQGPGAVYVARAYGNPMPANAAAGMVGVSMVANGIPLTLYRRYVP